MEHFFPELWEKLRDGAHVQIKNKKQNKQKKDDNSHF